MADSGADYIKTSTGFSKAGATIEDVSLLKENLHDKIKIKASGGIRTAQFAVDLVKAGADVLGTSSGIKIMKETEEMEKLLARKKYKL